MEMSLNDDESANWKEKMNYGITNGLVVVLVRPTTPMMGWGGALCAPLWG